MATQVKTPQISDNVENSSMTKQAVMNGNFDIWQRGTSTTGLASYDLADRWRNGVNADGGTLPTTITRSRQLITPGDIFGANYFYRIAPNGSGSGFGANAIWETTQRIENGTRLLCGAGKSVTISFWAKSSIANKKIGIRLVQNYGTGGSPTGDETRNGTFWTLTSSWTKYTYTFTTNTLVGKTFGTNNDDFLQPGIGIMWGSTTQTSFGDTTAETFVGSGNIDIAQFQLCAGDEVLPFQPKTYGQELSDCQRYCFVIKCPANVGCSDWSNAGSTTTCYPWINLPTPFRVAPSEFTVTPSDWTLSDGAGIVDVTGLTTSGYDQAINTTRVQLQCTVASGLTQFRTYQLAADAGGTRTLVLGAEL